MQKLRSLFTLGVILASGGTALSDGMPPGVGNCPHPPRHVTPPKKKEAPPAVPLALPPPGPVPCACKGQRGPQGDPGVPGLQGPVGPQGQDGLTQIILVNDEARADLRLGAMGTVYAPHGDWGWGPALQLTYPMRHTELAVEAGYAGPADGHWSPGRQEGVMAHLGVAGLGELSWTAGVRYDRIVGDAANGNVSAQYVAADVGFVLRESLGHGFDLRVTAGPTLGGIQATDASGPKLVAGLAGGAFVGGPL